MSKNILIIDDCASARQASRTALEGAGYNVIEAGVGYFGINPARPHILRSSGFGLS